jgi:hypothetical protein
MVTIALRPAKIAWIVVGEEGAKRKRLLVGASPAARDNSQISIDEAGFFSLLNKHIEIFVLVLFLTDRGLDCGIRWSRLSLC